jgi:hypothetical protein
VKIILKTRCGCWRELDVIGPDVSKRFVVVAMYSDVTYHPYHPIDTEVVTERTRRFLFREYDDHGRPVYLEEMP